MSRGGALECFVRFRREQIDEVCHCAKSGSDYSFVNDIMPTLRAPRRLFEDVIRNGRIGGGHSVQNPVEWDFRSGRIACSHDSISVSASCRTEDWMRRTFTFQVRGKGLTNSSWCHGSLRCSENTCSTPPFSTA